MKVKLSQIVIDPTIQVRDVQAHTVSRYRQALRSGAKFPPVVLEKGTNRMVCGNHRYYMYKGELEPESEIDCIFESYKAEADLIKRAAADNSQHGLPLSSFDKKRIIQALQKYKVEINEISEIMNIPVKRVQDLAGLRVIVTGHKGKKKYKREAPVKHGLEHLCVSGKSVSEKQYSEHEKKDRGVPAKNLAASLTRWLENGWIDSGDEKTMENMRALYDALVVFFAGGKSKAVG